MNEKEPNDTKYLQVFSLKIDGENNISNDTNLYEILHETEENYGCIDTEDDWEAFIPKSEVNHIVIDDADEPEEIRSQLVVLGDQTLTDKNKEDLKEALLNHIKKDQKKVLALNAFTDWLVVDWKEIEKMARGDDNYE